jgi:hypothetical protein
MKEEKMGKSPSVETKEVLERWVFDIESDQTADATK